MSLEADFYSMATGNADLSALISDRLFPLTLPLGTTLPAGVYQVISDTGELIFGAGAGNLKRARIQVTWSATQYSKVKAVADAAEAALDGADAANSIKTIWKESERDGYGTQSKVYTVRQDYMMWHDTNE